MKTLFKSPLLRILAVLITMAALSEYEVAARQESTEEEREEREEKEVEADYEDNEIRGDSEDFNRDSFGIIQMDESDPVWFKKNQANIPCFKSAQHGLYDLSGLQNQQSDWHV